MNKKKEIFINPEEFSKRLNELFKEQGKKGQELAEDLYIIPGTVSRWRNGKTIPDITYLKQIANFFGVRFEWIAGIDPYKTTQELPVGRILGTTIAKDQFYESLGYHFQIANEQFMNGQLESIDWILSYDNTSVVISNKEREQLDREVVDFVNYKMTSIFRDKDVK